jgi:hypothetical protein
MVAWAGEEQFRPTSILRKRRKRWRFPIHSRISKTCAVLLIVSAVWSGLGVEGRKPRGLSCALCHTIAMETQIELDKTANSTEVEHAPDRLLEHTHTLMRP